MSPVLTKVLSSVFGRDRLVSGLELVAVATREPLRVLLVGAMFGVESLGEVMSVFVCYLVAVPFANFGLGDLMFRFLPESGRNVRESIGLALLIRTAAAGAVAVLFVGFFLASGEMLRGSGVLVLLLAVALTVNLGPVAGAAARHQRRDGLALGIAASGTLTALLATLITGVLWDAQVAVGTGTLAEAASGAMVATLMLRPRFSRGLLHRRRLVPLLRQCVLSMAGSASIQFYRQADVLLAAAFLSPGLVGTYTFLSRLCAVSALPGQVIATVMRPSLVSPSGAPDPASILTSAAQLGSLCRIVLAASIVVAVVILPLFASGSTVELLSAAVVLLTACYLQTGTMFGAWAITIYRRSLYLLIGSVGSAVVSVSAGLLLVPRLGLAGAALVALLGTTGCTFPILLWRRDLQPFGTAFVRAYLGIANYGDSPAGAPAWAGQRPGSRAARTEACDLARSGWEPDFIGIGGIRCGSTWLHELFRAQPGIWVPAGKELEYFNRAFNRGPNWYRARFPNQAKLLLGEVSPQYLHSAIALDRIAATCRRTKFIVVLRDPVMRAYSHYMMDRRDVWGDVRKHAAEFETAVRLQGSRYVEFGHYSRQLAPFVEKVGRERIKLIRFSDIKHHPLGVAREVLEFIGCAGAPLVACPPPANTARQYRSQVAFHLGAGAAAILRGCGRGDIVDGIRNRGALFVLRRMLERPVDLPPMSESAREYLEDVYRGEADQIRSLLGEDAGW